MEAQDWRGRAFAADTLALPNGRPFMDIGIDHGRALAQAIVDTTASRSWFSIRTCA
jgi:hypothetical protein